MNPMPPSRQIHGTAVVIDGRGVLLLGQSGSGKSDLALRLIDRGAALVADDRVDLALVDGHLTMAPPRIGAGLIEVRGLGILRIGCVARAPLTLAVRLVPREAIERLPEPAYETFLGVRVRLVQIDPFELSAPVKVEWALRQLPLSVEARL